MNRPLPDAGRIWTAESAGRTGRVALTAQRAPDGRTYLAGQHATYPFHLCRPHYVAGDPGGMATLYLQSIAGGVFEHDRLSVDCAVGDGAALHLTSQGATIVHSMTGGEAALTTTLFAGADSLIELLPEATILFPGARLRQETVVTAHPTAVVCASEAFLAHDPGARGDTFAHVLSEVRFATSDGRVLVQDRQAFSGDAFRALSADGPRAFTAYGSLQLWAPGRDLDRLRTALARELSTRDEAYVGASVLPGDCGIGVRILATDGATLREAWVSAWRVIRHVLFASEPRPRRK